VAEIEGRSFGKGESVQTDGTVFTKCSFDGAQLRYAGGEHPSFIDCTFNQVGWYFEDAALRTIQLLQANGEGEAGRIFIEDLFRPGHYIGP
jgi:uncharacterized protein YjbI with pentapeptide repeats